MIEDREYETRDIDQKGQPPFNNTEGIAGVLMLAAIGTFTVIGCYLWMFQ